MRPERKCSLAVSCKAPGCRQGPPSGNVEGNLQTTTPLQGTRSQDYVPMKTSRQEAGTQKSFRQTGCRWVSNRQLQLQYRKQALGTQQESGNHTKDQTVRQAGRQTGSRWLETGRNAAVAEQAGIQQADRQAAGG
jgi:hypothetical protein